MSASMLEASETDNGEQWAASRLKHVLHFLTFESLSENMGPKKQGSSAVLSMGTVVAVTCPLWLCLLVAVYTVMPRAKVMMNRILVMGNKRSRSAAAFPTLLSSTWPGLVASVVTQAYFALSTAILLRRLAYYILPQGTFRRWLLQAIEHRVSYTSGDESTRHQRFVSRRVPRRGRRRAKHARLVERRRLQQEAEEVEDVRLAELGALAAVAVAKSDQGRVVGHTDDGDAGQGAAKHQERIWIPDDQLNYLRKLLANDEGLRASENCSEWVKFVDKSVEGLRVEGYRRENLVIGTTQYMTRTRILNVAAKQMHEFYLDDQYRQQWDSHLVSSRIIAEGDRATRSAVVLWERKYPIIKQNRDYVFARRSWENEADGYYTVTKGIEHDGCSPSKGCVRVRLFYSSWHCSDFVDENGARGAETVLIHFEDMGVQKDVQRFAVRMGFWGVAKAVGLACQRRARAEVTSSDITSAVTRQADACKPPTDATTGSKEAEAATPRSRLRETGSPRKLFSSYRTPSCNVFEDGEMDRSCNAADGIEESAHEGDEAYSRSKQRAVRVLSTAACLAMFAVSIMRRRQR